MADTNQPEATAFFRQAGFTTIKNVDMHFQDRSGLVSAQGKAIYPTKGIPDMCFFRGCWGGFCEVKSSRGKSGEYFFFSQIDLDKRKWWDENKDNEIQYWLFLGMGNTITDKKYPRIALLMPVVTMLQIESESDKKSFHHRDAMTSQYRLEWKGKGLWTLPVNHPFKSIFPVKDRS